MNWQTIIVLTVVAALFVLIVASFVRNKKKGKAACACSCGSSCGGCPMSGSCHKNG